MPLLNINKESIYRKTHQAISSFLVVAFISTSIANPAFAKDIALAGSMPLLPNPGTMVNLSSQFTPAHLKGMVIHPENALKFDFIIHRGDPHLTQGEKKDEYNKLIKYFLASLAVPDEDQWVNLSPYEKDRIIKDDFGKTAMGRDLLAQDYMLKQISSSLIHPESKLGQKFWEKVYSQAHALYGMSNVPVNTFNKVWIVPDEALIYEKENTVYIVKHHLKVMLEQDYLSLEKHNNVGAITNRPKLGRLITAPTDVNQIGSQIVREIILPALEKEVNEGKNFAQLRQVYSGMLLAAWYKRALKESILSKIYADRSKLKGIAQDPKVNQKIYEQYLKAFKKGVFNFIKDDVDRLTNESIPRKYFSGGTIGDGAMFNQIAKNATPAQAREDLALNNSSFDFAQTILNKANPSAPSKNENKNASMLNQLIPQFASQGIDLNQFLSRLEYSAPTKAHLLSHHALLDELVGIMMVQNFKANKPQEIFDFFMWALRQGYLTRETAGVVDPIDFSDLVGKDKDELIKELKDSSYIDENGEVLIDTNQPVALSHKFQDKADQIQGILLGKSRFRISPDFVGFNDDDKRHAIGIKPKDIVEIENAFKKAAQRSKIMSPYEGVLRLFINGHDSGYTMDIANAIYKDDLIKVWTMIAKVSLKDQVDPNELDQEALKLAERTYELMMDYSNPTTDFMATEEERLTKEYAVIKEKATEMEITEARENARKKARIVLAKAQMFLTKVLAHGTTSVVLVKRSLVSKGIDENKALGLAFLFAAHHPGFPITLVNNFVIPGIVPKELESILLINNSKNDPDQLRFEIAKMALDLLGIKPEQDELYEQALAVAAIGFANDRTTPARRFENVDVSEIRIENGVLIGNFSIKGGETNKKYGLIPLNVFDKESLTIENFFKLTLINLEKEAEAALATLRFFRDNTTNKNGLFDELIKIYEEQTRLEIARTKEAQDKILGLINTKGRLGKQEGFSGKMEDILTMIDLALREYNSMSLEDPDRDTVAYLLGFLLTIYKNPDAMDRIKSILKGDDVKKKQQGLMSALGQYFDDPLEFTRFLENFGDKIQRVTIPRGQVIFSQGEPASRTNGMYFVVSGQVKIEVDKHDGTGSHVVAYRGAGPLGEMALLDNSPRTATVTTSREVTAYFISREAFNALGDKREEFIEMLKRIQAQRLEEQEEILNENPSRTGFNNELSYLVGLFRVSDGQESLARTLPKGVHILRPEVIKRISGHAKKGETFEKVTVNGFEGEEGVYRLLNIGDGLEATNSYGGAFYLKPEVPGGIAGYVQLATGEMIGIRGFDLVGEGAVLELINGGAVSVVDPKRKATVYILPGTSVLGVSVESFRQAFMNDERFKIGVTQKHTIRYEQNSTPLAGFLKQLKIGKNFKAGHVLNPFIKMTPEEIAQRLLDAQDLITGRATNKETPKLLKHYLHVGDYSAARLGLMNSKVGLLAFLRNTKGKVIDSLRKEDSPWVVAIENELNSFYEVTPNIRDRLIWFFDRMDTLVEEGLITKYYAGLRIAMVNSIIPNYRELGLEDIILHETNKYLPLNRIDELSSIQGPLSAAQSSLLTKAEQPKAATELRGGIDLNSANLDLQIKRDGQGMPLPFLQQNQVQLNSIEGLEPDILQIIPAVNLPSLLKLQ